MYKGGRPRDSVWQHFLEVTINMKQFAKCKQCGNTQLAKAARRKLHQEKCAKVSMDMVHDDVQPADDNVATTSSVK